MDDIERLCLARHWADEAAAWLGNELAHGRIYGTTEEAHGRLETLRDGLNVFADTLHALSLPYPPPSLPPVRRLHVVK